MFLDIVSPKDGTLIITTSNHWSEIHWFVDWNQIKSWTAVNEGLYIKNSCKRAPVSLSSRCIYMGLDL